MYFYIVYRLNPNLVSGLIPILSQHSELDWMVSVDIVRHKNMYLIYNIFYIQHIIIYTINNHCGTYN